MRSKYFYAISILLIAIFLAVGSGSLFAQGNGKGKGGGKKGGGNQGGGNQRQVRVPQENRQPQMRQQMPQMKRQMPEMRREAPQMRGQREQPRFKQERTEQRGRQMMNWPPMRGQHQQPRQERKIDRGRGQEQISQPRGWERMRERRVNEQRANQERQKNFREDKHQRQFPQIFKGEREDRGNWRSRENYNGKSRRDRRDSSAGEGNESFRRSGPPSWSNAWPDNYGYRRSNEVHERNALRKAAKNEARVARWFVNDRYAYLPEYRTNRSAFEEHELWRTNFLRSIVSNVRHVNYSYDDYYSYQPIYISSNYDQDHYDNGYQGYPDFASSYYGDSGYYPTYASEYDLHPDAYYNDAFPYEIFSDSDYDNSYSRSLSSRLVAYGYEQGYYEGLAAGRAGYGTRYFDDPYVYEPTYYSAEGSDSYSYIPHSYSLGENRLFLSNGYQLGYMDALHGGNGYDDYEGGNTDLVSALLSLVSTVF